MSRSIRVYLCLSVVLFLFSVAFAAEPVARQSLPAKFAKLLPLHKKLEKPKPGEWLAEHRESGQNYRQYNAGHPIRADKQRRTIYIQPLGEFTAEEKKIVDQTAEFMGEYFQLPVKIREKLSLSVVPQTARRKRSGAAEQILSTYVLDNLLKPRLPKDAVAQIAFTAADLWPGEGWNYVFGQASLGDRVGVWSIHRYGNPADGDKAFRLCLLRTMKTATHETGHMFTMNHCTFFECNMCGSNHLPEADSHPVELCPVCLAKLCYATGADPAKRFERLAAFYREHGFKAEQEFCEKSLQALR